MDNLEKANFTLKGGVNVAVAGCCLERQSSGGSPNRGVKATLGGERNALAGRCAASPVMAVSGWQWNRVARIPIVPSLKTQPRPTPPCWVMAATQQPLLPRLLLVCHMKRGMLIPLSTQTHIRCQWGQMRRALSPWATETWRIQTNG